LEDLDVNAYIISGDTPEEQLELYNALEEEYGKSLPFISDPELELIEKFNMKNEDAAYRGYGMLDTDGKVVFNKVNDHWGEQLSQTMEEIKKEYEKLSNK
jgi:alkyl hydroperoxide reductase subunit AhpC